PTHPKNRHGYRSVRGNQRTETPDHNNTSLFIMKLPPNCTVAQLLRNIRGCGKIYSASITRPTVQHVTAAAKLIFFDTHAANKLYNLSISRQWKVGGYLPVVAWNRVPVGFTRSKDESRVIGIYGPKSVVTQDYFELKVFSTFYYKLAEVIIHYEDDDFRVMEFQFGSYSKQAEFAMQRIRSFGETPSLPEKERALWRKVEAKYLPDPCARPATISSGEAGPSNS
ncbi:hypothetical protein F5Y06DRAFT_305739, partial [Hypoxylon sp. FL0890]